MGGAKINTTLKPTSQNPIPNPQRMQPIPQTIAPARSTLTAIRLRSTGLDTPEHDGRIRNDEERRVVTRGNGSNCGQSAGCRVSAMGVCGFCDECWARRLERNQHNAQTTTPNPQRTQPAPQTIAPAPCTLTPFESRNLTLSMVRSRASWSGP